METKLLEVKQLFEAGDYYKASQAALELIKQNEFVREAYIIFAKAYLNLLPNPSDESKINTFYNAAASAAKNSATVEEFLDAEYEIKTALNDWKRKTLRSAVAMIENNPSFDEWRVFINLPVKYTEMILFVGVHMRTAMKPIAEAQGIEMKNVNAKEISNGVGDDEIHRWVYQAGCNIFKSATKVLEEEKYAAGEYLKGVMDKCVRQIVLSQLMANYAIPRKDDDLNDSHLEYLKTEAHILNYLLNTMVYPNGQEMSLYNGNREAEITKLKGVYEKIKLLEPDYEAPALPSEEATKPAPQGGCYVATAVYGSYDCPEVWTLRRYRDDILAKTYLGRMFIKAYYAISPTLVKWFGDADWFRNMFKPTLEKMVKKLNVNGVENTPYEDKNWK